MAAGGSAAGGSLWSAGAFRTAGPGGRGPVRGYPPAPGAPDPVYPPGQFSPWNSPAPPTAGSAGRSGLGAGAGTDTPEPGYPLLAVSDPAADATATQTWAVLDDAQLSGEWTAPAGSAGVAGAGAAVPDAVAADLLAGDAAAGDSCPRGPFEPAGGFPEPPGFPPPSGVPGPAFAGQAGYPGQAGYADHAAPPGETDYQGRAGFPGETGYPGQAAAGEPGYPGWPGEDDQSGETGYPRPGGRLAARQSRQAGLEAPPWAADDAVQSMPGLEPAGPGTGGRRPANVTPSGGPPTGAPPRGSRSAARGGKPRKARKPASRARMWLMPLVMMVVVGVLIAVAYIHFVKGQQTASTAATPIRKNTASSRPAPSLGPWKHITNRTDDPVALTLTELFPARFSSGGTVAIRTIRRAGANCASMVLGTALQAALRKAGCTQVMRASYLSTAQKIMATIGVLNLSDVTAAQRAGQATGATAFIKQLPAAHGPTHNLANGTGLEEAQFKGHYLILTWAEFTNLRAPGSAAQRAELDTFSRNLVAGTATITLTSRMLFGKPEVP